MARLLSHKKDPYFRASKLATTVSHFTQGIMWRAGVAPYDISSIMSRTPMPQIHGNGQASPWSNMDVFVHGESWKFQPWLPPPRWLGLETPALYWDYLTHLLIQPDMFLGHRCISFRAHDPLTHPQFFCPCACISSFFIMPVLTRSIPQLCGLGQDC